MIQKFLQDVEDGKKFYAWNGAIIKNLSELDESMRNMDRLTFSHHSNQDRNDFYNWVKEVIGDEHLAGLIKMASTPEETRSIVEARVAELKKIAAVKKSTSVQPSNNQEYNPLDFSTAEDDNAIGQKFKMATNMAILEGRRKKTEISINDKNRLSKYIKTPNVSRDQLRRPIKLRKKSKMFKSASSSRKYLTLKEGRSDCNQRSISHMPSNQRNIDHENLKHELHSYTNRHVLLNGMKDFLIGLFIGLVTAIILLRFIKF